MRSWLSKRGTGAGREPSQAAREPADGAGRDERLGALRAPGAPGAPPVIVPRWIQLVMLPTALLGLWALAQHGQAIQQGAPADAADHVPHEQQARARLRPVWGRLRLSHTLAMVGRA